MNLLERFAPHTVNTIAVIGLIISLIFSTTVLRKDIVQPRARPTNPYIQCLNIFITETRKDRKNVDFKEAKSLCFELIKNEK